jgi:kinesin family protein C1
LEDRLSSAESARRELHNALQELKGNIRVFCRVRPETEGAGESAIDQPEVGKLTLYQGTESYNFTLDRVFGAASTQEEVFEEVSGMVQSALDGYKACVFAYGQTGSGKTYTMQGLAAPETWGLIPRALRQIFAASEDMRGKGWEWSLQASFLEVYNEQLRDLLAKTPAGSAAPCHAIKHDEAWGTVVTNMTCIEVDSMEQINALMARAAKQRAVGTTDMNDHSSRSHSVFALYLTGVHAEQRTELRGALHLVDLAGSERLDRSNATGDRLKETQNINRSLSSLADVFLAKAEGRAHVPFRNSKLTHLMEPCLSGQGKTMMVVNVAPERDNTAESLCSLRFAGQVSQCNTGGKPKRSAKVAAPGGGYPGAPSSSSSRSVTPAPLAPAPGFARSVTPGVAQRFAAATASSVAQRRR